MKRLCMIALAVGSTLGAQQIRKPVLAHVFDSDLGDIRIIGGVAGAAVADATLGSAMRLSRAVVASSDLAVATVESEEGRRTVLVAWPRGVTSLTRMESAIEFDLAEFSPDGRTAALYSRSLGKVQVWASLGLETRVWAEHADAGEIETLAVSDEGIVAVARGGLVEMWDASGARRAVWEVGGTASLSFSRGGSDLAATDSSSGQILLIRSGAVNVLAGAGMGIEKPLAVAWTADGRRLLAGLETAVAIVDLPTGAVMKIDCGCRADSLARARAESVYRLGAAGKRGLAFLDLGGEPPSVFTVPFASGDKQ